MVKNIAKTLLFWAIFLGLFLGISTVFVPKNNTQSAGIHAHEAKGFLGEKPETLDVLFVGDSEAYCSFVPLRIWEQQGIPSYVCAGGDQMIYQCFSYVERFFENQSPKVVVLETNTLYRPYTVADLLGHHSQELLPYLRYHDRWKNLQPNDFGGEVAFTGTVRDKGYNYRTETSFTDTEGYMAPSEEAEPVPLMSRVYVNQILDLCREHGARLILVSTPSPTNWSIYYHNGVTAMAEELGVTYLDLNLMPEAVPIDWTQESFDGGDHLNYDGAVKVTDYLGQYLMDTGLFEDKRDLEDYNAWNEDLEEFYREIDNAGNARG